LLTAIFMCLHCNDCCSGVCVTCRLLLCDCGCLAMAIGWLFFHKKISCCELAVAIVVTACHHCGRTLLLLRGIMVITLHGIAAAVAVTIAVVDCHFTNQILPAGYGHCCRILPPLSCNTVIAIGLVFPWLQCVCYLVMLLPLRHRLQGWLFLNCAHRRHCHLLPPWCCNLLVLILRHHALTQNPTWCAVAAVVCCFENAYVAGWLWLSLSPLRHDSVAMKPAFCVLRWLYLALNLPLPSLWPISASLSLGVAVGWCQLLGWCQPLPPLPPLQPPSSK